MEACVRIRNAKVLIGNSNILVHLRCQLQKENWITFECDVSVVVENKNVCWNHSLSFSSVVFLFVCDHDCSSPVHQNQYIMPPMTYIPAVI